MGQVGSCRTRPSVRNAVVDVEQAFAQKSRYTTARLDKNYAIQGDFVVGEGKSGPVRLAVSVDDGRKCAVKSFSKIGLSSEDRNALKSEVEIYLSVDHPHIAKLERVFESKDKVHLVMECMEGGELFSRLAAKSRYNEEVAAFTTYQILLAVAYLHDRSIAHLDLKLENVLYGSKDGEHLKLIDFGFAKRWGQSGAMSQSCGTLYYVAPEVFARSYTCKADCWSVGVIVYMLLTGSAPFPGTTHDTVCARIRTGVMHVRSRFSELSDVAQDFVKSLLVLSPETRLSAQQALDHPWLREVSRRKNGQSNAFGFDILQSFRCYSQASSFRRAVLSVMAWSLSPDDRKKLDDAFLQLDVDRKGMISHEQMKHLLMERFGVDCEEASALFRSLDTDDDKKVAYTEFLAAAMQGPGVAVHESVIRRTFLSFDADMSGAISADDLKSVLGDSWEGVGVEEMLKEADTDGNGKIDYEEFLKYVHRTVDDAPVPDGEAENSPQNVNAARSTPCSLTKWCLPERPPRTVATTSEVCRPGRMRRCAGARTLLGTNR